MSRTKTYFTTLSVILAGLMVFATMPAAAVISGSAHDFSGAGWNSSGEICIVCHTPHNAAAAAGPLWNHEETATASFTLYTSTTLNATMSQPSGISKLCLGCHDGTVAVDNFGGTTTGTQTIDLINAAAEVGTDLSNDHPVSFTYDTALSGADGSLTDPVDAAGSGLTGLELFGGQLECATCHDVHNEPGIASLLRVSNAGSALCLTCHTK